MSMLDIIATHLSVSDRTGVTADIVAEALRAGGPPEGVPEAAAMLLAFMFTEHPPQQIVPAAREAKASIEAVNRLYRWSLDQGSPKSLQWEEYAKGVLG